MTALGFGFAGGAALVQLLPALPSPVWGWALPLVVGAGMYGGVRGGVWRGLAILAAVVAGFAWAAALAAQRIADRLDPALEGQTLQIVGVVSGLPQPIERGWRFALAVESEALGRRLPARLRLSWYAPDAVVHPGERWQFQVRLRRPHGALNPHGFDYEAWLLERGIGATGYVHGRAQAIRLGERGSLLDRIDRLRERVVTRFQADLGERPAAGVLAALAVGAQSAITAEEWQLFQRTGVTHLMSISGLHVTLVSGLVAWCVSLAWRRSALLVLWLPARIAAGLAAIVAAFGYTLLAGFAIPAQRTFFMVSVVALALCLGRLALPLRTLSLALFAVVLLDPWAALTPGFWLSFGAVALIFYTVTGWSGPEPAPVQWLRMLQWLRIPQWLRIQWAITLGLAPGIALLFGQVSLVGPLANAIAIPLVSAVITPIALLAALLPIEVLAETGAWLIERLLEFLEWCALLPWALWRVPAPPPWSIALALAGVAWMLAPRGIPGRVFGLCLVAPAFLLPAPRPAPGEAWITTLDVGQGLAVLVRTAEHALLYDAGPSFASGSDSGDRVVLPVLRAQGVGRLDAMVLTHADDDHIGGAQSVLQALDTGMLISSVGDDHPVWTLAAVREPCRGGRRWDWDGVRFELLHPAPEDPAKFQRANDLSCVLKVSTGSHAMLLTGDIEVRGEQRILERAAADPGALRADVLLVPHHGSRTSSSAAFVQAVGPRVAIVSAGYRSRFGHPHPLVLERYRRACIGLLRTDRLGAIRIVLTPGGLGIDAERQRRPRYWRTADPRPVADLAPPIIDGPSAELHTCTRPPFASPEPDGSRNSACACAC